MKHNILITGTLHPIAIEKFKNNLSVELNYRPECPREEIFQEIKNAHVLISRSETDIDQKLIDAGPQLKLIARGAVGVGNIDIDYATEKGILIVNCPGKNTNSAAELTMGLLLSMMRKIPHAQETMKKGGWDRHRFTGFELRGKKIGIVGLGNVGHRVAKFALGFDMEVFAYDPYIAPEVFRRHGAIQCESLFDIAKKVDILTLHIPLNKETKNMITKEILYAMPSGSYLLNAARGGLVSEEIILEALSEGQLSAVGIDTFEKEPKPNPNLISHPNVYCTPHIGASTVEAQILIGQTVYEQVMKSLEGQVVDYPINLPEIGVIQNIFVKSYAVLAEKLGSMLGQLLEFNPTKMMIQYRGSLSKEEHHLIRLSLLKGYAGHVLNEYVLFVNVNSHIEKMGIKIEEKEDPSFQSYRSAIKISVAGQTPEEKLMLGGVVFDETNIRLSLINDFYFEVEPMGHMLIVENHDRPGVIGDLGNFLAKKNVNIDTFHLSRNKKGGKAMALIRIDSPLDGKELPQLQNLKNIIRVKLLSI